MTRRLVAVAFAGLTLACLPGCASCDSTTNEGGSSDSGVDEPDSGVDEEVGLQTNRAVVAVEPLASVHPSASESDQTIQIFVERRDFTLDQAVDVDAHAPGDYATMSDRDVTAIPAGTAVDSYYVHYDPIGAPDDLRTEGSVTFPHEIIGVAMLATTIEPSNEAIDVASLLTEYPSTADGDDDGYQIDLDYESDLVTIGPDRKTITLDLVTNHSSDSMRVFTKPN